MILRSRLRCRLMHRSRVSVGSLDAADFPVGLFRAVRLARQARDRTRTSSARQPFVRELLGFFAPPRIHGYCCYGCLSKLGGRRSMTNRC
jgi:hypothetical protein